MIILETDRLLLRHLHLFDVDPLQQVFADPEVMRFGSGVQTAQWIRAWVQECLANFYQNWGFGPWAVVDKHRHQVLGYCGLFYFPDINGHPEIEIGYRLGRAHWGHGYATEAVLAVRDYSFNVLCLPRLIAMIDPHNLASLRVAHKAGLRYENEIMLEGYTHPDHVYAIASQSTPLAKNQST